MQIACVPLTPALWPDLQTVFGPSGAFCGCWRRFWIEPREDFDAALKAKTTERDFRREVEAGPPPGLLAYRDGAPVGWVRVGPRRAMPQWYSPRRVSAPIDPSELESAAVWAITCFVVRRTERGKGVASALLNAACAFARENGAKAIDACPVETKAASSPASIYHGVASTFSRAGFLEIARRRDRRPLMRLELAPPQKLNRPGRKSR